MKLIQFFINQHKAINLLVVLIIGAGVFTFIDGQKEGFPTIGLDLVVINTPYPGASADTVEALVTEKIENEIESIEGAEEITSFSSADKSSIRFEIDGDSGRTTGQVIDDIKTAVESIEFAEGVEDSVIQKIEFGSSLVNIIAGFVGDADIEELKTLANRFKEDVKTVEGVGRVDFVNYPKREIWVEVDPQKLIEYDLDLSAVIASVKAENLNIPAGKITLKGKEFFIKTRKEYTSLADIENTILRSNDRGLTIRLSDLAKVRWAHEELSSYIRSGGNQGVWVRVYKAPQGDAIKISEAVTNILAQYEADNVLPANVQALTTDDLSFYVKRRLGVLTSNATFGLFLVFLCMIIFFNFRVTFWTLLGIPFSFCLTIILAYALGLTLNLTTMFGLIIVVGMVVDDAIIISESIYSYTERGFSFYEAAILGTREMLVPVIAIVTTSVLAFLPLMTLPGTFGKVIGFIPKMVILALFASLIECIFILPGHLAYLKNKNKNTPNLQSSKSLPPTGDSSTPLPTHSSILSQVPTLPVTQKWYIRLTQVFKNNNPSELPLTAPLNKPAKSSRHWFVVLNNFYERLLDRALKRPILVSALFILILCGSGFYMLKEVPFVFFPGRADNIDINVETPPYNSLDATAKTLDEIELRVREVTADKDYIVDIISTVGRDNKHRGVPNSQSHLGYTRIYLDTAREESDAELSALIEEAIADVPGIVHKRISLPRSGPGTGGGGVSIYISGNSLDSINDAAGEVSSFLSTFPNLTSISSSYETGKEEIYIYPDSELTAMMGISPQNIASSVRNAFASTSSTALTSFSEWNTNDEETSLVIKYHEGNDETLSSVYNTPIRNNQGYNIPLKNISELDFQASSSRLTRANTELYISVTARLKKEQSKEQGAPVIIKTVQRQMKNWEKAYPNLSFAIRGRHERQQELTAGIVRALFLSLFSIYFVLTIIFRSYIQPLIIMSIIPLGFIGVIWGLYLNNTPLGLMSLLGGLALMGVVINDSLVMIDKINRLRRDTHLDKRTAIIQGAKARMRPILMTSLTTIVGIAPLAYGILGQEPFLAPMGIALLWGLILSTPLLLILLPAFYLIVENSIEGLHRLFKKEYSFTPPHYISKESNTLPPVQKKLM